MKAASYIEWSEMKRVVEELKRFNKPAKTRMALLIFLGSSIALRISDLKRLAWGDLLKNGEVVDFIRVRERKTHKLRKISVNQSTKDQIKEAYVALGAPDLEDFIFCNRKGQPWSTRYCDAEMSRINVRHGLNVETFSTHSLRKTFSRRVLARRPNDPLAMVLLQEILNHSSMAVTRRYIGIRQEEIESVYLDL